MRTGWISLLFCGGGCAYGNACVLSVVIVNGRFIVHCY